jgi:hypothetical protein
MKLLPPLLIGFAVWLLIALLWFAFNGRPFLSIGCGCAAVLFAFIGLREADALNPDHINQ